MSTPAGFVRIAGDPGELWALAERARELTDARLHQRSRWDELLRAGSAAGRGRVAFVELPGGPLLLKQLRRGGALRSLWRDRFVGRGRLLANLTVPREARRRGVRTPHSVALMLIGGPPGLWRGWLATERIPGAVDLWRRYRERSPDDDELRTALAEVRRLHDAGIEHLDLNLGNLVLDAEGAPWIVDLDKARIHDEPLGPDARRRALERLERSYRKSCRQTGREPRPAEDWPRLYAP